ncbi:MAG: hypothetical protein AMS20_13850 [Gemmatimonas sp. SG8_28]|jgi:ATP phosphoribosyltransferase regulatory subunit HisZ|nr:MAG: hypothetical protein AMS20_13850 [Gemmatimonas sp. SG8_28]
MERMRHVSIWSPPALVLLGGCLGGGEHRPAQKPEVPDTLHFLAAFRSEVRAQLDALEHRIEHLTVLRDSAAPAAGRGFAARLDSMEQRVAAVEQRLTTIAFHDAERWRTTKQEVDSTVDALRLTVARTEIRARRPP